MYRNVAVGYQYLAKTRLGRSMKYNVLIRHKILSIYQDAAVRLLINVENSSMGRTLKGVFSFFPREEPSTDVAQFGRFAAE
jgi:hypothetical protein